MKSFLPNANEYIASGQAVMETYAMTDDVTDPEFDAALDAAKEERNLSRANDRHRKAPTPKRCRGSS